MKFVYVLEDDPKFQQELVEAIAVTDPKIQVRIFPKLETFAAWMKTMMTTGPAAIRTRPLHHHTCYTRLAHHSRQPH